METIKHLMNLHRKYVFPGAMALILLGLILLAAGLRQTVVVRVDGQSREVRTGSLRVSGILRAAGIELSPADRVHPSRRSWVWHQPLITVETARQVIIKLPDSERALYSAERIPANLLLEAGIELFPQDQLFLDGAPVSIGDRISSPGDDLLQYVPAVPIQLVMDGDVKTIYTDQVNLGAALEMAGIRIHPADVVDPDLLTSTQDPLTVTIRRAAPVTVLQDGSPLVTGLSAAETIGGALLDVGVPLQNLNFTLLPEETALPEDGIIEVVSVEEKITVVTEEVQYQNDTIEDPETPLDQVTVIEPGRLGITANRERVRLVGDEEVWRDVDGPWQASETRNGVLGIGTKVVIQTAVVDGETLEYYRKFRVFTTSYKPCDLAGNCYYGTSSGLPVDKGVIAVRESWFLAMRGQRVYVPGYGYGVIADVCGGCVGKPWFDLGYSEEGYPVPAPPNRWTDVYLLTPVPSYIPVPFP